MKLFNTNNIETVKMHFSFELPAVQLSKRIGNFETRFYAAKC